VSLFSLRIRQIPLERRLRGLQMRCWPITCAIAGNHTQKPVPVHWLIYRCFRVTLSENRNAFPAPENYFTICCLLFWSTSCHDPLQAVDGKFVISGYGLISLKLDVSISASRWQVFAAADATNNTFLALNFCHDNHRQQTALEYWQP
jgi:hypothetical protein